MTAMEHLQDLDTRGARAAETFVIGGVRYLAIPQLAYDVPGRPAQMTQGDSDTELLLYRWEEGEGAHFVPHQRLLVPGGEDAEYFSIDGRHFLATASLRSGAGPYTMALPSTIFEWRGDRFEPFQQVPTVAAKQWTHFPIGARHFLLLAQGAAGEGEAPSAQAASQLFEWDGAAFRPFQALPSAWGYNGAFFEVGGERLLAYADHAAPSRLLRWNGQAFEPFQPLDDKGGRAFCFFETRGQAWLAFANLQGESVLYRWAGGRFERHQVLSGPGGREWLWLPDAGGDGGSGGDGQLLQVHFLTGSREAPVTALSSRFYRFEGARMAECGRFDTLGGTDATAFESGGQRYLVVTHALGADRRFHTPSKVYRLGRAA